MVLIIAGNIALMTLVTVAVVTLLGRAIAMSRANDHHHVAGGVTAFSGAWHDQSGEALERAA
jgi:hypothetical protein